MIIFVQAFVLCAVGLSAPVLRSPRDELPPLKISIVLTYLCTHSKELTRTVLSDLMRSEEAEKHVKVFYTFPGVKLRDISAPASNANGFDLTVVDKWLGCITVQKNIKQVDMFNAIACTMALDWQNLTSTPIKECISSNGISPSEVARCATGDAGSLLQERAIQGIDRDLAIAKFQHNALLEGKLRSSTMDEHIANSAN